MHTSRKWSFLIGLFVLLAGTGLSLAQDFGLLALPAGVEHWDLQVDGVSREALVYIPAAAKQKPTPVVFVFHGHGGNSRNALRTFPMQREWPDAISVYMQGLKTPGRLTDPQGLRNGWQQGAGDQHDRDLKVFDAVWARLQQDYQVDKKRVFCTGHSNGGAFTYLLWAERGDVFAAVAPCAGMTVGSIPKLKPKPVMHIAGEKDPLVKFEWQQRTIEAVRKLDGCDAEGKPWAKECTLYSSKTGTPVVAFIHPGGHLVPPAAPELIVRFFKEMTK